MKTKHLAFLILLYCFLGLPCLISGFFTTIAISYVVKLIILCLLIKYVFCGAIPRYVYITGVLLVIWTIGSLLCHSEYFSQTIAIFLDSIFVIFIYQIFSKRKNVCDKISYIIIKGSFFVSIAIIVATLLYHFLPTVWTVEQFSNYHHNHFPLLGYIANSKIRPCWYFAEPSYCGFYLGLALLFGSNVDFSKFKLKKSSFHIVVLTAFILTFSSGSIICITTAWFVSILRRFFPEKTLLITLYSIVILLFIIVTIFDFFDYFNLDSANFSYDDRIRRMVMGKEAYASMGFKDILWGLGPESVSIKNDSGLSDAYTKMFCECGFLYFIWFLMSVRFFVKKNITILTYLLFAFFNVIIQAAPLSFLFYLLIHFNSKIKYAK